MLLNDQKRALAAIQQLHPQKDSRESKCLWVQVLAEHSLCHEALAVFLTMEPNLELDVSLYEAIGWAWLQRGISSGGMAEKVSLAGAVMSGNPKGVHLLYQALFSENPSLRALSIYLSRWSRDSMIVDRIYALLEEEKIEFVRLEALKAIRFFSAQKSLPVLEKFIEKSSRSDKELHAAITAYLLLSGEIEERKIDFLLCHKKAQMRYLGLELLLHTSQWDQGAKIKPLLFDPNSKLRTLSLFSLLLFNGIEQGEIPEDLSPFHLGCLNLLMDQKLESIPLLFTENYSIDEQLHFACLITKKDLRNPEFLAIVHSLLKQDLDPFVRLHLAIGLLKQGIQVEMALEEVVHFLIDSDSLLIEEESIGSLMSYYKRAKSVLFQNKDQPLLTDRTIRFHLISLLHAYDHPKTTELALQVFHRYFYLPIDPLLDEGIAKEVEGYIFHLPLDSMPKVRLSLLLTRAFLFQDETTKKSLLELYPQVGLKEKIQILEALGYLKGEDSIHFFLSVMQEPFEILQITAAASLLRAIH